VVVEALAASARHYSAARSAVNNRRADPAIIIM